jgi:ABC-type nitrate/sulfonate/bicarbonate transport system substrate-binding protein
MEAAQALWVTRCAVPTASSVALEDGLLERALAPVGLRPAMLGDATAPATHDAHYSHALQRLVREGGNVPALWARSRGAPTRLIGLTWADEYQAVVTRPDAHLHEAADLRGARLGIVRDPTRAIDHRAAMALHGHRSALAVAGLELGDARLVQTDVPFDGHLAGSAQIAVLPPQWRRDAESLMAGAVDAIYVKGAPGIATVAALGLREVVSLGDHPDRRLRVNNGTPRTITVDAALARRPEVLDAVLEALLAAADRVAADPAALHGRVAADTGADAASARAAYGEVALHPRLDGEVREALERQRDFLRDHGFLEHDVDLDAWIDDEPLRRVLARRAARASTPRERPVAP